MVLLDIQLGGVGKNPDFDFSVFRKHSFVVVIVMCEIVDVEGFMVGLRMSPRSDFSKAIS